MIRQTPGQRGTGVWAEQRGAWVPSLLAAGFGEAPGRMASDMPNTTWKVMSQISDTLKNSCFEIKGLQKQH
jgi:hypothetical protein